MVSSCCNDSWQEKIKVKNYILGLLALVTTTAFYGLYGIFSRLIGPSFGNFGQNWIRNLVVLFIITLVILVSKTSLKRIQRQDIKWIALWFLSGSWVTVLTFIAFNHLTIATAYLLIYSSMISAGFISGKVFFGEKLNFIKVISLILCFVGLLIIYGLSISAADVVFGVMCLVSGFMTGIWNTISKKFSDHYPNSQMVMMDAISSVAAALIGSWIFKETLPVNIQPLSWLWIIVYAVVQTINVGLIVYGFKHTEAQIGSIILPIEVIFATLFAFLIFKEVPSIYTIVGGVFILTAAIIPNIKFKHS